MSTGPGSATWKQCLHLINCTKGTRAPPSPAVGEPDTSQGTTLQEGQAPSPGRGREALRPGLGVPLSLPCSPAPAPLHRESPLRAALWVPLLHGSWPRCCCRPGCHPLESRGQWLPVQPHPRPRPQMPTGPGAQAGRCCGPGSQLHSWPRGGQAGRSL